MGAFAGGAMRLVQTALYFLAFCASGIILGFFSYFLAVLSNRKEFISKDWKAVEGISGVAVVYTIFAVVLTCCLGGVTFFAFVAIVLDLCFVGGFIAIAVLTRQGAYKCRGIVNTPLGTGYTYDGSGFGAHGFGTGQDQHATYQVTYGTACRYNKASFICAIIGAFLFLILAAFQVALVRHHKREKRFGPSPANDYTSGYGKRRFWQRRRNDRGLEAAAGDGAVGGLAAAHHHHNEEMRPSHDTAFTGSTVGNTANGTGPKHF